MLALGVSSLVAILMVTTVSGSCFQGFSALNAKGVEVCHVELGEPPLHLGEIRVTNDCYNCSCHAADHKYVCCGVGPNAGVVSVPEGYEVYNDWENCTMKVVPIPEDPPVQVPVEK